MESKRTCHPSGPRAGREKGYNIRILHVENLTTVTDYFVIATGNSTTHVGALADEADFQRAARGRRRCCAPRAMTASAGCCWIERCRQPMTSMTWSTCGLTPRSCPPKNGKKSRKSRRKHGCWMAALSWELALKEHKIQRGA